MKAGRKKKAEDLKRKYMTNVRLTEEEHNILLDCSEKMDATKSEVLIAGLLMVQDDLNNKGNGEA